MFLSMKPPYSNEEVIHANPGKEPNQPPPVTVPWLTPYFPKERSLSILSPCLTPILSESLVIKQELFRTAPLRFGPVINNR
jgi:hypothetical protein